MTMARMVDAVVTINNVVIRAQEAMVDDEAEIDDVTVTTGEGAGPTAVTKIGRKAKLVDVAGARVMVRNGTYDPAEALFPPGIIDLQSGVYYDIKIFPQGLASKPWHFPSLAMRKVSQGGRIPGPAPVSFEGESDGDYTYPA